MQPTFTKKAVLNFDRFEIETGTWKNVMTVECKVESTKFSSGVFQDAFHATTVHGDKWVLKTFSIITQVIIEILVLSLAENDVVFCYNHLRRIAASRFVNREFTKPRRQRQRERR